MAAIAEGRRGGAEGAAATKVAPIAATHAPGSWAEKGAKAGWLSLPPAALPLDLIALDNDDDSSSSSSSSFLPDTFKSIYDTPAAEGAWGGPFHLLRHALRVKDPPPLTEREWVWLLTRPGWEWNGGAGGTAWHAVARRGEVGLLGRMVEVVPGDIARRLAKRRDAAGRTPLFVAVEGNCLPAVTLLVDLTPEVINISTFNDMGAQTPLHVAMESGYADITLILQQNGADVAIADGAGVTPWAMMGAQWARAATPDSEGPATMHNCCCGGNARKFVARLARGPAN